VESIAAGYTVPPSPSFSLVTNQTLWCRTFPIAWVTSVSMSLSAAPTSALPAGPPVGP
jgi:hypothetical protein